MAAGQILEDGDEIEELVVVSVGEPAADGYGVLWMEDVGCGGIIDDYCFAEVTTDLGEILREGSARIRGESCDLKYIP